MLPVNLNVFISATATFSSSTGGCEPQIWWLVGELLEEHTDSAREGLQVAMAESPKARNGSFKRSVADDLSETGARHFSMNSLTCGSVTLLRAAGFIPEITFLNTWA